MSENKLTIGQLSQETDVTIRTLRYYDKIGLLRPSDYREGGHRLYGKDELLRLQKIQSLKFIGFSLKDIAGMVEKRRWIDQDELNQTIKLKREELKVQLEDIQQTIDQLDHMQTVIEEQRHVNLRVFCFMINAIIWEEKYLDKHENLKKFYHHSRSERANLDQRYFNLFTSIKHLVSQNTSPSSTQAQACAEKLEELTTETISGTTDNDLQQIEELNLVNEYNVLHPLTSEEQEFLECSMYHYYYGSKFE